MRGTYRADVSDRDPGLFGPESVTWRVHGHLSAIVGGLRALLLQTLHPLAMAGIAQHSDYKRDPIGRFQRTATFVAETTYGTTDEAHAAIDRVRSVHRRVQGVAPDGRPYRANDPELLSWVHNTLVDSVLAAYRRFGPGLPDDDADRYVGEMTVLGRILGANGLPVSAGDLRRWVEHHPDRRATRAARDAARFLVLPALPIVLLPPYGVVAAAAVSLLPVRDRIALRLPSFPPADALVVVPATRLFLAGAGLVLGTSPALRAAEARLSA